MALWPLLAIGVVALVGMISKARTIGRRRVEAELAIRTANGVDEATFIRLRGVDQWVQVRGESRDHPVMLVLHGGPGMSYATPRFTRWFRAWEPHFVVVQWDRPGVGKTFARHRRTAQGPLTLSRMRDDGIALAEHLRVRFPSSPLILFGHSAGSVVGLMMIASRPDLFAAYVGADQLVDMPRNETLSYELLKARLEARRDASGARRLAAIGPPPFATVDAWSRKQDLIMRTDGTALSVRLWDMLTMPHHSLSDVYALVRGYFFSARVLFAELMKFQASSLGDTVAAPVAFIQGDADIMTVTSLVAEYVDGLRAPRKELVVLKGGPHLALATMPEEFLTELRRVLRPALTAPPKPAVS